MSSFQEIEGRIGISLPPTLIEFCKLYNGGLLDEKNCFYRVPIAYWAFHAEFGSQDGVILDGLYGVENEQTAYDLEAEYCSLQKALSIEILPIGFNLLGDGAVMRVDQLTGAVYWRDHGLWEEQSVPVLFPIAESLEDFYNSLGDDPNENEREG